ncbi:glycosyltransferase, partial [Campylobacter insulaenigrae]|uniref:glycosyltransferase n=1 Tax=Campylobacter insulaenigrae TaxID=260714 RepID=UPI0021539845
NIAKEYTLKDERFILFDKENGGQSTARNVGIEYFSGEYKLQSTNTENDLIEFDVENNHYNIYKAYKSSKAFNNNLENFSHPLIDYIIFLDSDDYWELNCIEECVPRMEGVDVLWFDEGKDYEITHNNQVQNSRLKDINIQQEKKINPTEWLYCLVKNKIKDFSFVCSGTINFDYILSKKLKFKDHIFAEDHLFGILLFSQAKNIYIYPKVFYYYRIRTNSSTNQDKKITTENILPHFKSIYDAFNKDAYLAKEYFKSYSWVMIADAIDTFCDANKNQIVKLVRNVLLPFYIRRAYSIKKFDKDPKDIKCKLEKIKYGKISKICYKFKMAMLKVKLKRLLYA